MTKLLKHLTMTVLVMVALSSLAQAQQVQAEKIPMKLQIVISKYEGDRKTSSLPYTALVTANGDRINLQANANVPYTSSTGVISYTNIGTTIDCTVTTDSGRFKVALSLHDNSPIVLKATPANAKLPDAAAYGNFNYTGSITMKEGETKQIISSSDRTTGEVVKVDVTLTLDK